MEKRTQILVRGIVQGVGFRPYIFSLASRRALRGRVFNNSAGVLIDVEGEPTAIEQFIKEIESNPPPLALIESVERRDHPAPANFHDFRIVESDKSGVKAAPISVDLATCAHCLREVFNPADRRYRYPFINCTNCGPRFTIIEAIPYDRARTTMRDFEMCDQCRAEYDNPLDRRFHAEATACPRCGPRLFLKDARGGEIKPSPREDLIGVVQKLLLNGMIVAIKGLGGFHLACDATNTQTVERLRRQKYREDKPFALMADAVEIIKKYCLISEAEEDLLRSASRPIVLLIRRPDVLIPRAIAPGVKTVGFMLPYTPLHHLLCAGLNRPLVMTSGNVSDEPISYRDDDAERRLHQIADYFLLHNRRIHMRTDDSVTRSFEGREMISRRSRGYAPAPIKTAFKFRRQVLACGAELKNTFCLARDHYAFVSHHIGDLENLETMRSFSDGIEHFKRLYQIEPEVVAYDLHPEYLSTKHALALDEIETKIGIQHHHAHIASCMVDNLIDGPVIGVAMDGLGLGTDGRWWGCEFFIADFAHAERIMHLDYVPLPGGAKAIKEPWRMAAAYLHRAFGDEFLQLELPFVQNLNRDSWSTLRGMIKAGINSPQTSSMGRLFDALSSLLSLRHTVNYEGQAAIELETIADQLVTEAYEFEVAYSARLIRAEIVIQQAVVDLLSGRSAPEVAAKFHLGIVNLISQVASHLRDEHKLNRVVLSGGVFQNLYLLKRVCRKLRQEGFEVFTHHRVPTNDGGISLGQAAIANARLASIK